MSEAPGLGGERCLALVQRHEAVEVPGVDSGDDGLQHLLGRRSGHRVDSFPSFRYTMCVTEWRRYLPLIDVSRLTTHYESRNPPKRKYELKKRATEMAETHLRITEAAIELHGTFGPSRTTMSAVAERAGVERRTLYRHFPNEADLFAACSTHYFAANPWPEPKGGARFAIRSSDLSEPLTSSTPTTSAPSRCSATCSATPSTSTSPAPPWRRWTRTSKRRPRSSSLVAMCAAADKNCCGSAPPCPRLLDLALTRGQWRERSEAVTLSTALVEAAAAR